VSVSPATRTHGQSFSKPGWTQWTYLHIVWPHFYIQNWNLCQMGHVLNIFCWLSVVFSILWHLVEVCTCFLPGSESSMPWNFRTFIPKARGVKRRVRGPERAAQKAPEGMTDRQTTYTHDPSIIWWWLKKTLFYHLSCSHIEQHT